MAERFELHQMGDVPPAYNPYGGLDEEEGLPTPVVHRPRRKSRQKSFSKDSDRLQANEGLYDQTHIELQRLIEEERMLLSTPGLSAGEAQSIRESFFHQQLELINQLPEDEASPYRPEKRVITKLGVERHNIHMEEKQSNKPYFCYTVLVINTLMFVVEMWDANWEFEDTSINPLYGPSSISLLRLGAKDVNKIRDGAWWRLIMPNFLHAGIIHVLLSNLVLFRLGVIIEESFGWWRTCLIYLTSGVFGVICSCVFVPTVLTVGSSTPTFGLIGALFGDFIQNHKFMLRGKCAYMTVLTVVSLVGLAIGLLPDVDNFAHVGAWLMGLVTGVSFLVGIMKNHDGKAVTVWYNMPLVVISLVLAVVLYIVVLSVLYSEVDGNEWCSWCHNVSCVEIGLWDCD